eukprot:scaffold1277_cov253-Pinguiococcus_pyrenoidosus.AAC.3
MRNRLTRSRSIANFKVALLYRAEFLFPPHLTVRLRFPRRFCQRRKGTVSSPPHAAFSSSVETQLAAPVTASSRPLPSFESLRTLMPRRRSSRRARRALLTCSRCRSSATSSSFRLSSHGRC